MFEFERIKNTDKIVCIIIYVSINSKFLRIDNTAFS